LTYDTANRLTSVCYAAGVCPAASKTTWTYDTVGNRSSEKVGSATATTYTYDNADQLINAVVGTVTAATYGYDADGNQTTAGPRVSTFNAAAQTVSIQDGVSPVTTYSYDGGGKRLTATSGAATSRFSWDTNSSLPMLAIESDTAGALIRRYTYGVDPISVSTPTATSYYVTDEIGSTTHVTSSAGATQWAYTYTPFGTTKTGVKVDPLASSNPMKFTGQYEDPTGNYNLRARLYNPSLGIFTQTDPLAADVGSPYPSSYVYGNNNPTMYVDPSGLRGIYKKYLESPNPDFVLTENLSQEFRETAGQYILAAPTDLECGQRVLQYVARYDDITLAVHLCRYWRDTEQTAGFSQRTKNLEAGNLRKLFLNFQSSRGIGEAWASILTINAFTKQPVVSGPCAPGNSFRYDTQVLMAGGTRKVISDLVVGDKVIATDPETGLTTERTITAVHLNLDTALADVTVIDADGDTSTIHTTQHHPFWDAGDKVWTDVVDLQKGDRLRSIDGSLLTVVSVRAFVGRAWMWDLTVEGIHTFFVANGDEPILVHNQGGTTGKGSSGVLTELYEGGSVRGKTIIEIRAILLKGGFTQTINEGTKDSGYLFRNGTGEEVRIMNRNGGWDIRVKNSGQQFLDEKGNAPQGKGASQAAHGISVKCK
jgi:RHS repeat-associated protein